MIYCDCKTFVNTVYFSYLDVIAQLDASRLNAKHLLSPHRHGHSSGLILSPALILWGLTLSAIHDRSIDHLSESEIAS